MLTMMGVHATSNYPSTLWLVVLREVRCQSGILHTCQWARRKTSNVSNRLRWGRNELEQDGTFVRNSYLFTGPSVLRQ